MRMKSIKELAKYKRYIHNSHNKRNEISCNLLVPQSILNEWAKRKLEPYNRILQLYSIIRSVCSSTIPVCDFISFHFKFSLQCVSFLLFFHCSFSSCPLCCFIRSTFSVSFLSLSLSLSSSFSFPRCFDVSVFFSHSARYAIILLYVPCNIFSHCNEFYSFLFSKVWMNFLV